MQFRVEDYFEEDVPYHQREVYWTDTECNGQTSVVYRGECYHGVTFSCREMYVAIRQTLCKSALAHEYGHCLLMAMGKDPDPQHLYVEYWDTVEDCLDF